MSRPARIALVVGVLVVLQIAAIWLYRRRGQRPQPTGASIQRIDREAPLAELAVERAPGQLQNVSTRDGRPRLLHFWATWCPPCRAELPQLIDYSRHLASERGVELLAISVDRSWTEIDGFFAGRVPPEIVRAQSPTLHRTYGVDGLPDTYLVSGDGRLRARIPGARDWGRSDTRRALQGALDEVK